MASPRIEAVIRERHRMGECPVWEEETGQLVYVDINARTVCRWNPLSGEVQTMGLSTMPEASAPGVWEPGQGSLYTLFADCPVVRQLDQLGIHNGLDWSLDHRTLYHVDSLDYSVRAYDYDVQTGGLANPRLVCQLEPEQGMPDGLCVDTTGTLWVACIDGGRVIRMDPETGTQLCTLKMPVSRVTSCCFGGADYSDLYVTSAADSLSPEQLLREPQAGHVFKVTGLGVRGLASRPFAG